MSSPVFSRRQRDVKASYDTVSFYLIFVAFVLSRVAFHLAGVEFLYQREVEESIQYLDTQELKHNLLRSLLYLHSQPPLFNLLLGISFKLGGEAWHILMQGLFLACGLALNLLLFRLMRLLGCPAGVALAVTLLYMLSPSQILYENHLFYSYPTALLVTAGVWCALELAPRRTTGWAHGMAWSWAALCLLRSSYHLATVLFPWWLARHFLGTRKACIILAVPCLLALVWYGKNLAMFDNFGSSSWMGMNMAKIAVSPLPNAEKKELAARTGDPLALVQPFSPPASYQPFYAAVVWPGALPAFSSPYKANGYPNFNYGGYLPVSRRYESLALSAIRYFPDMYLRSVAIAVMFSTAPTDRSHYMNGNMVKIRPYADWYDLIVWLCPYLFLPPYDENTGVYTLSISLVVLFLFPVCLMYWWKQCCRNRYWRNMPVRFAGIVYITLWVGYAACVGNFLEIGENNRFRFDWEPLMIAIIASAPFQRQIRY